ALPALPRPVVGFFGLISEWFDVGLVDHLAASFPDVSFVLVGRACVDTAVLARRANVRLVGCVPYTELPRIARAFDVGLTPYVRNRFTPSITPLKLLESFALGLPVVATRLPELETVAGPLHLADSHEEFRERLRAVLAEGPQTWADEAVAVARANTWDRRAE